MSCPCRLAHIRDGRHLCAEGGALWPFLRSAWGVANEPGENTALVAISPARRLSP